MTILRFEVKREQAKTNAVKNVVKLDHLGAMGVFGTGGRGVGGVVGPGLGKAPGSDGSEVDAEGSGGAVGGQDLGETVAELREGRGQGLKTGYGGHAREMEGVAGGVEVAVECGWIFASKGEGGWGELEPIRGRDGLSFFVAGVGGGLSDGLKGDVAGD